MPTAARIAAHAELLGITELQAYRNLRALAEASRRMGGR